MPNKIVSYTLDDGSEVRFEIEPDGGPHQVGHGGSVGRIAEAVQPAVAAAQVVLQQVRSLQPGEVTVKFGVKVSGTANWLVAKAASEANFEVTMAWRPSGTDGAGSLNRAADSAEGGEGDTSGNDQDEPPQS
ncbi:CU044_2847 family protein [Streptomyces sp. NBC_01465]|uniref:CU044_2847 family protein n=1 Tax=Streptomyces sp. NBC_01465 TaxID=2903878 RepID=UPI002E3766B5|nr:CU044_2847 family protein [Streptomyces sp. NBC_01465]